MGQELTGRERTVVPLRYRCHGCKGLQGERNGELDWVHTSQKKVGWGGGGELAEGDDGRQVDDEVEGGEEGRDQAQNDGRSMKKKKKKYENNNVSNVPGD